MHTAYSASNMLNMEKSKNDPLKVGKFCSLKSSAMYLVDPGIFKQFFFLSWKCSTSGLFELCPLMNERGGLLEILLLKTN